MLLLFPLQNVNALILRVHLRLDLVDDAFHLQHHLLQLQDLLVNSDKLLSYLVDANEGDALLHFADDKLLAELRFLWCLDLRVFIVRSTHLFALSDDLRLLRQKTLKEQHVQCNDGEGAD